MASGGSFESYAAIHRISKKTLYNWRDAHPEFCEAKDVGIMLSLYWWEKKAMDNLVSSKETGTLNTGVYFINMRNRFGWKSANSPDAPSPDDNENDISKLWEKNRSER